VSSKAVVEELYRALERGDVDAVRRLLNPDVDWWFHGPRAHQHLVLMRLLTGRGGVLPFKIRSLDAFGPTVLAEGTDATGALYWVHAWTVGPGGRVTEVREYCNTALVVTRLGGGGGGAGTDADGAAAAAEKAKAPCSQSQSKQVWQSRLPDQARRNLPGLVLAI
jgi:ketosteroid isomerase-like protein